MVLPLDRRGFLVCNSILAASFVSATRADAKTAPRPAPRREGPWPGFPQQDPALVKEIVGASHGNLARVKELTAAHPALANAAYDWGFGDWESALGAASHTGNKAIAAVLLEHGARLDLFAATMLGMEQVVRAMIAARPGVERTGGPHGISLLDHARAGKHEALVAFLGSLEGAGPVQTGEITPAELASYLGTYRVEGGGTLEVIEQRGRPALKADGGAARALFKDGEHLFFPAGAANVRVTFTMRQGRAVRIEIAEAEWAVGATIQG